MRTSDVALSFGLIALALGLAPAASFDGSRTPERAPITGPMTEQASRMLAVRRRSPPFRRRLMSGRV